MSNSTNTDANLDQWHPFDHLPKSVRVEVKKELVAIDKKDGETVFGIDDEVEYLYIVGSGVIELKSPEGEVISHLEAGETYGARAIIRGSKSTESAVCKESGCQFALPVESFKKLLAEHTAFAESFNQFTKIGHRELVATLDSNNALITTKVSELMTSDPVTIGPENSIRNAAKIMSDKSISCVLICENEKLIGVLTSGDLTERVVAVGVDIDLPVSTVMSKQPKSISPNSMYVDALNEMSSSAIGHMPVVYQEKPIGIVTRTDLVKQSNVSPVYIINDIWRLEDFQELAGVVANLPKLLAQLVSSGVDAYRIGFVISGITDALTKRLIQLAEKKLGAPPVPYLWLACGSQGRQEQTGVSDQDNCLMLGDSYDEIEHGPYFEKLAKFVSDGLDACGYVYCPGEMMATNPSWRQPVGVWRKYFTDWIEKPNPMAQMLASVMFDLRPIAGDFSLYEGVQNETLELSGKNSIFLAHMISNSLSHSPPLGVFRGFALIRSGEHKDTLDLKHSGTVPIVDIARLYSIQAGIKPVNTRERLKQAMEAKVLSEQGALDMIDAYDLISDIRLGHQANLVKQGKKPDNFVPPASLSALQRNYLKNAFSVVKTIQSSLSYKSVR